MKSHLNQWMRIGAVVLILSTAACAMPNGEGAIPDDEEQQVEQKVNATLTAMAADATQKAETKPPTETEPPMGRLTGKLAYPSEFLPPQRVVAFDVTDMAIYFSTDVTSGGIYEIELPPGTYLVVAYLIDPSELGMMPGFSAGYSQAVLCGLDVECEDHSLVPVDVVGGDERVEINPIDWYAPFEQMVDWPEDPNQKGTGSIRGRLGYPSEYIPPLRVVAFDVFSQDYFFIETELNQTEYQMDDLPPGTYHVIAYVIDAESDFGGAYSQFVTCGLNVDCTDHSLIDVYVYPGQVTEDVDPVDFYTRPSEAGWPEDPTQ